MAHLAVEGNASKFEEMTTADSGTKYMRFLFVEEKRKKKGDEWVSLGANFFNVTVFNTHAETLNHIVQEQGLKSLSLVLAGDYTPGTKYTDENGEERQGRPNFVANSVGLNLRGLYNLERAAGTLEEGAPKKKSAPAPKKSKKKELPVEDDFDDMSADDLFED